jgi:nicotinamide riboside kinase
MLFVLTGPESTGKTAITYALARHFGVPAVPEIARDYLAESTGYLPCDLLHIAQLQADAESLVVDRELAFGDTDQQVLYVWWQERFGAAPRVLIERYRHQSWRRHYLLCAPDLPWETDPLRENPDDRDRLFSIYRNDLQARGLGYDVISGSGDERIEMALRCVRAQLGSLTHPP